MRLSFGRSRQVAAASFLVTLAALLLAYAAAAREPIPYITLGAMAAAVGYLMVSEHVRLREIVLWAVILVAVFNFTPALLSPLPLNEEPLANKVIKDVAIFFLLGAAVLVPPARPVTNARLRRLLGLFGSAIAVLAVVMLADLVVRETSVLSFVVSLRYYVIYPLLVFAILKFDLSSREIERLLKGIVVLAAIEGGIAVLNFLNLVGDTYYADYVFFGGQSYSRAIGTLGNPDNLGLFLGLPAMILLFSRRIFGRGQRILLFVPILAGMATTFSLASAAALGLAVLLMPRGDQPRGLGRVRAALTFVLSATLVYFAIEGRHGGDSSATRLLGSRIENVPDSFERWVSSPLTFLFGEGFGSQAIASDSGITTVVADNMVLTLALEGGMVGLVAFAALLFVAVRLVHLGLRNDRSGLVSGLYGFALFFLLYSATSVNFRLFPGAMFFWIVLGLSLTLARASRPEELASATEPSEPVQRNGGSGRLREADVASLGRP